MVSTPTANTTPKAKFKFVVICMGNGGRGGGGGAGGRVGTKLQVAIVSRTITNNTFLEN